MSLIPAYALYGESDLFPDVLHCESIHRRSALLGWTIKAHHHPDLHQFFWIESGGSCLQLDGEELTLPAGSVLSLPPFAVHGFTFAANTRGWVVTAPRFQLERSLGHERSQGQGESALNSLSTPFHTALHVDDPQRRRGVRLFDALAEEHRNQDSDRPLALLSWLGLLAVWFARQQDMTVTEQTRPADNKNRKLALLKRFKQEVEDHFRSQLGIGDYARRLGVSSTHLSRICREVSGQPASHLLQQRQLLEAKRALVYTTLTIAEVGYSLGFSDPAYFSRFFTKLTGQSPRQYRERKAF
ncbi:helix-turn-helix domain-containing protein [Rhodovibrionaceae bacterium A322]